MTNITKTMVGGILLSSIFSGCATKSNATIACFKGSSTCISQQIEIEKKCVTCVAII